MNYNIVQECIKNLKKNGFDAHFIKDVNTASELITNWIIHYESFGIGGSETVRSLNIVNILRKKGKIVYDHWEKGLTKEQDFELRLKQGRCDCFLCSANAISASGEIVNIDGIGNRVAAMSFGPKRVVVIAGVNKITPDLVSAIKRAREIAGPLRAKSLGLSTPCAETGTCMDCNSPHRICRITLILNRCPALTPVSVVLIDEHLGY